MMRSLLFLVSIALVSMVHSQSMTIETVDSLNNVAFSLFYSQPDKAYEIAATTQRISQQISYPKGEIRGVNIQGIVYDVSGRPDSSSFYFTKGYHLSKQYGLPELEGNGLNNLGMMNWNRGNFNEALQYFLEALKVYESISHELGISKATSNIGLIYQELGQFGKALSFNRRALQKRLDAGSADHIARSYNNIGICHKGQEQYDSALYYYEKGLEYALSDSIMNVVSSIYDNMANVYDLQNRHEMAIEYHFRALEIGTTPVGVIATYNNIASIYNEIGDNRSALMLLFKSDSVAKAAGMFGHKEDTYRNLAEAYIGLGNKEKALHYFKEWDTLKDSIYSAESAKAVVEMQTKYETEKKEQQVQLLTAENDLQEAEIRQTQLLVIAVVGFSIMLTIALAAYFSRQRYKLKASLAEEKERLLKTRFKAVIDAEEKERVRIARELHDGLGQLLSTARITVSSIGEGNVKKVNNSVKIIDMAVKEVRSISHNLMPNALVSLGLEKALVEIMRKVDDSGSIKGVFESNVKLAYDASSSISIYRAVQEAVNNAIKYAEATEIKLQIVQEDDQLEFTVSDNGKGFDTADVQRSVGIGWSNIHSRIELIGGTVVVRSLRSVGTTIHIRVPEHATIAVSA